MAFRKSNKTKSKPKSVSKEIYEILQQLVELNSKIKTSGGAEATIQLINKGLYGNLDLDKRIQTICEQNFREKIYKVIPAAELEEYYTHVSGLYKTLYLNLGYSYDNLRQPENVKKAMLKYRSLCSIDSDDDYLDAQSLLAFAHFSLGENEEAKNILLEIIHRQSLDEKNNNVEVKQNSRIIGESNVQDKLVKSHRVLIEIFHRSPALVSEEQAYASMKICKQSNTCAGQVGYFRYSRHIGINLRKSGQFSEAINHYRDLAEIENVCFQIRTYYALGKIELDDCNNFAEAASYFEKGLNLYRANKSNIENNSGDPKYCDDPNAPPLTKVIAGLAYDLADIYLFPDLGLMPDINKGIEYLQFSVKHGLAHAYDLMGQLYQSGDYFKRRSKKASCYYLKAIKINQSTDKSIELDYHSKRNLLTLFIENKNFNKDEELRLIEQKNTEIVRREGLDKITAERIKVKEAKYFYELGNYYNLKAMAKSEYDAELFQKAIDYYKQSAGLGDENAKQLDLTPEAFKEKYQQEKNDTNVAEESILENSADNFPHAAASAVSNATGLAEQKSPLQTTNQESNKEDQNRVWQTINNELRDIYKNSNVDETHRRVITLLTDKVNELNQGHLNSKTLVRIIHRLGMHTENSMVDRQFHASKIVAIEEYLRAAERWLVAQNPDTRENANDIVWLVEGISKLYLSSKIVGNILENLYARITAHLDAFTPQQLIAVLYATGRMDNNNEAILKRHTNTILQYILNLKNLTAELQRGDMAALLQACSILQVAGYIQLPDKLKITLLMSVLKLKLTMNPSVAAEFKNDDIDDFRQDMNYRQLHQIYRALYLLLRQNFIKSDDDKSEKLLAPFRLKVEQLLSELSEKLKTVDKPDSTISASQKDFIDYLSRFMPHPEIEKVFNLTAVDSVFTKMELNKPVGIPVVVEFDGPTHFVHQRLGDQDRPLYTLKDQAKKSYIEISSKLKVISYGYYDYDRWPDMSSQQLDEHLNTVFSSIGGLPVGEKWTEKKSENRANRKKVLQQMSHLPRRNFFTEQPHVPSSTANDDVHAPSLTSDQTGSEKQQKM